MRIIYTTKFKREYKRLANNIKDTAEEKEKIFRVNPFDEKLDTHKLNGKLKDFWSFSINHNYRIIFEISKDKKEFFFHSIGNHSIYK